MTEKTNQEVQATETTDTTAVHAAIKANFDNKVDVKEVKFHFKKMTDKESGVESKRPTLELLLPVPSVEGIIDILSKSDNEKELALLIEAITDVITSRAREIITDKEDITQDTFPMVELSWAAIANLPKAERRGGGISKELWEAFFADYIVVMPGITGKTASQVELATKVFGQKFANVKTDKKVLKLLKDQLGLYVTNSANAENFVECVEFLTTKADTLISTDESNLLNNL